MYSVFTPGLIKNKISHEQTIASAVFGFQTKVQLEPMTTNCKFVFTGISDNTYPALCMIIVVKRSRLLISLELRQFETRSIVALCENRKSSNS